MILPLEMGWMITYSWDLLSEKSIKNVPLAISKKVRIKGAKLILDGRENGKIHEKGYFVGPTIFDDVTTEMKVWQDEIFAPVLSIVRVKDLDEAIDVTNQSPFANGSCLFTRDGASVRQFRKNIDAGMLGINIGVPALMAFFPFSRVKGFLLW